VAGIAKSHSHAALTPVRTQPATRISPADEVKLLIAAVRESVCVQGFGCRPRCTPHRSGRPSSETLHNRAIL